LFTYIPWRWSHWIYLKKEAQLQPPTLPERTPRLAFNLISFVVYVAAVALGQFGYAFGWFAIVAATDIFVSAFNLLGKDTASGRLDMPPPDVQVGLTLMNLSIDAVVAALVIGGTLLFQQVVVLV